MRFLLIFWCLCASVLLRSQSTVDSVGVYHAVEAGQTLYSISKTYNVTVEQVVSDNPGCDTSLRVGQKLWIRSTISEKKSNTSYVVKAGDTYYGISRAHGITVDELKALNNGMPAGLIAGDTILVPAIKGRLTAEAPTQPKLKGNGYKIALMLPFYTSTKDSLAARDLRLRDAAVQMYRGVMAAADTLESRGLIAEIQVFDVTDNKTSLHTVLESKGMKGVDLIIGPLFKDLIPEVVDWCKENDADVVIPVQQPNRVLLNAPCLSKSVAGSVTQWMSIARYAHESFAENNVVLIDSKILDDRKLVESFKEEWARLAHDSLRKIVVCDDINNLKIAPQLPTGKCLVAVPTADKKVIAAVFKALGTRLDVDVIGMESWDDMEAISSDLRNRFHVTFPKQLFIDPQDKYVVRWQDVYRKKFNSEPTDFSITGYDVMLYCGETMLTHGRQFPGNWTGVRANTLGTTFNFYKSNPESGFENSAIHILRTENFHLTQVN